MLRIGIDGSCFSKRFSGVGRYAFELCRALDSALPNALFFVYSKSTDNLPSFSDRWISRIDPPRPGLFARTRWLRYHVAKYCSQDKVDVFWATATLAPVLPAHVRIVATVHDLNYILVPETMRTGTLLTHRLFFSSSLTRASAITAISKGTADRLSELLGLRATAVVPPGVSDVFYRRSEQTIEARRHAYGLDSPYLLSVATKEPRKNLALLIRTFLAMKRDGLLAAHKLVLVGDSGWRSTSLSRLLRRVPRDLVVSLGYVSDDDLSALYSGSEALVFPSVYEGFGMPLAEARACGTRIVSTDLPELREAGDSRGVYVPPTEKGIRSGIVSCLTQPRPLPAERSHLFTWTSAATIMSGIVSNLVRPQAKRTNNNI
jgi:glycosyltransferase involved in cell wall biosynthesis